MKRNDFLMRLQIFKVLSAVFLFCFFDRLHQESFPRGIIINRTLEKVAAAATRTRKFRQVSRAKNLERQRLPNKYGRWKNLKNRNVW